MYVQRLCQIQNTLNEMFAKQKTERDALAKKYRYVEYKVCIYRNSLKQY